jgi:PhnB protein
MQMNAYLTFSGECEAAFKFYEECLDGKVGELFRYAGTPLAEQVPADWQNKVMHGSLAIGEQEVMGGDVPPDRYEKPKGFSLSLQMKSTTEAERIFSAPGEGRHGRGAAQGDVLGCSLWNARRSVWYPVAHQLRGIGRALT